MSVSPIDTQIYILYCFKNYSWGYNMNLFEKLTVKEQEILIQFFNGFTMSEVAIIKQCTLEEVDEYR